MSAKFVYKLEVAVTNGDALLANKKTGKSNSGTYFICSLKDYDENIKAFFDANVSYCMCVNKIEEYKTLIHELCFKDTSSFPGNVAEFDQYCNALSSQSSPIEVKVGLRFNDSRVFLRFTNNKDPYVKALRSLLFGEVSELILELNGHNCEIYPDICSTKINPDIQSSIFDITEEK
jgi:hypothetical protein